MTHRELKLARREIVLHIRDTVNELGMYGAIVAMSGAVGSTLTAVLAVEALGKDQALGLSMPCYKAEGLHAHEACIIAEAL